jgi:hypothetical protein
MYKRIACLCILSCFIHSSPLRACDLGEPDQKGSSFFSRFYQSVPDVVGYIRNAYNSYYYPTESFDPNDVTSYEKCFGSLPSHPYLTGDEVLEAKDKPIVKNNRQWQVKPRTTNDLDKINGRPFTELKQVIAHEPFSVDLNGMLSYPHIFVCDVTKSIKSVEVNTQLTDEEMANPLVKRVMLPYTFEKISSVLATTFPYKARVQLSKQEMSHEIIQQLLQPVAFEELCLLVNTYPQFEGLSLISKEQIDIPVIAGLLLPCSFADLSTWIESEIKKFPQLYTNDRRTKEQMASAIILRKVEGWCREEFGMMLVANPQLYLSAIIQLGLSAHIQNTIQQTAFFIPDKTEKESFLKRHGID